MPMTISTVWSPVRKRAVVNSEIGTRLATYMVMLLPRLTSSAASTDSTEAAMKR